MAKKKKTLTPEEEIQQIISGMVVDSEYRVAANNNSGINTDFDAMIDMLESKRNEKDYEWMSDYNLPEMISILLTDSSGWASTMFTTRDFCEVKLDGEKPEDFLSARATKKVINKTLNDRDLFYYQKYMRLRLINALVGHCYVICWWDQVMKSKSITVNAPTRTGMDDNGMPIVEMMPKERTVEIPVIDRFNFDVLDPRNVFTDNKYCYTAQQKDWIIVRSEVTYEQLVMDREKNGYFNLDKVRESIRDSRIGKSDTNKETYGKDTDGEFSKPVVKYFDLLDRYGKFWAIVKERDEHDNPILCTPGIDRDGLPIENAELVEMISTFVLIGNTKIMIRFEPTPFIDSYGNPYKPIIRGSCYIHPVKDEGLSDGKYMRELQIAINDTFNMSSDRVKLATLPVFKGRKYAIEDNSSIYIEPEHVIELENVDDLQELHISDNVKGALDQLGMLTGKMQQVTSIYPTTMGALPSSETTATAIAGSEQRSNARGNYKSLTFEYTFLTEFYWTIMQMSYRFAKDETLLRMLGDDAQHFDARLDYTYTPVSTAIEAEQNKYKKIQLYDQTIGRISGMVQQLPEVIPIIAHMLGRQLELQGDEFAQIGGMIDKLSKAKVQPEGGAPMQTKDMPDQATSNQSGVTMSTMEKDARNGMLSQSGGGMIR